MFHEFVADEQGRKKNEAIILLLFFTFVDKPPQKLKTILLLGHKHFCLFLGPLCCPFCTPSLRIHGRKGQEKEILNRLDLWC